MRVKSSTSGSMYSLAAFLFAVMILAPNAASATTHCGTLASDEVWAAEDNPHIVTCDVIVPNGVTLTIMPNAIVRFYSSRSLLVYGSLKAIGIDENNEIIFTSAKDTLGGSPDDGDWKQIVFAGSVGDSLVHCQIRYGGYYAPTPYPQVDVSGCSPTFVDCTIRDGRSHALKFSGGAHAVLENCSIYRHGGVAMSVDVSSLPVWEGDYGQIYNNTHDGIAFNGIYIHSGGGNITTSAHWRKMGYTEDSQYNKYGIPIFVEGDLQLQSNATLRLDPGVTLNFRYYSSFIVYGSLKAIGTSENPILFTSYRDVSGGSPAHSDWKQVVFAGSVGDSLMHCQIRYGGYRAPTPYPQVDVSGCSPTFVNCTIRDGRFHALKFSGGAHAVLENCSIYRHGGVAMYTDVSSLPVWEGEYGPTRIYENIFNSVDYRGIYLPGGTMNANGLFRRMGTLSGSSNRGIPFYIGSELTVGEGVTCEIEAGVTIRFYTGIGMTVNGTLIARGNAGQEVHFISHLDAPSVTQYWKQILFNSFSGGSMEYCRFKHGGRSGSTSYYALSSSNSSPIVRHCYFETCYAGMIEAKNGATPLVRYSSLLTGSTSIYGVYSDCPAVVDARHCFFGNASGPYHPTSNPGGTGSRVSDCVLFDPWWLEAYGTPEIAVYPAKLGESVERESTSQLILGIRNRDTTSVLSYSIGEGVPADPSVLAAQSEGNAEIFKAGDRIIAFANVSWLSVDPAQGLLEPDGAADVNVIFDSHGMACGSYEAYLIISSNDDDEDPIIVPVAMLVYEVGVSGVDSSTALPGVLALGPNYPNPFNPTTAITYFLPQNGNARLAIYDARGGLIKNLVLGPQPAGFHEVRWNGTNEMGAPVASGVYFARLEAHGGASTRKIIMAR